MSYEVGRYFEERVHHVWPLEPPPGDDRQGRGVHAQLRRLGNFLGRFFGPARAFVPLIAGIFEMPRTPFQAANVASAMVWAFGLLAPGAGLMEWLRG